MEGSVVRLEKDIDVPRTVEHSDDFDAFGDRTVEDDVAANRKASKAFYDLVAGTAPMPGLETSA